MTSWIQLLVQWEAVANQISLTAPVLFAAWIWSTVWSTPVSINTSYTVDIYVPLMENFPFLPVVPLTSSLCSGPLENSAVKLSGSKCQALWLVCIFQWEPLLFAPLEDRRLSLAFSFFLRQDCTNCPWIGLRDSGAFAWDNDEQTSPNTISDDGVLWLELFPSSWKHCQSAQFAVESPHCITIRDCLFLTVVSHTELSKTRY